MNATETAQVVETITGYWPTSDQRAVGMARWLRDRDVDAADARHALEQLAEQYDQLPSIKQLGVKLHEIGASTRAEVGVGDARVIAGMVERFGAYARAAAEREHITYLERLRQEQETHRIYHDEAVKYETDDAAYYRDCLTAYSQLIGKEMGS